MDNSLVTEYKKLKTEFKYNLKHNYFFKTIRIKIWKKNIEKNHKIETKYKNKRKYKK